MLILITGASSGIGLAAARKLIGEGHQLIVTSRKVFRLKELFGDAVDCRVLDLSESASIREFCDGIIRDYGSLDVLLNNAGMFSLPHRVSPNGCEITFNVNCKGTAALTAGLLPVLRKGGNDGRKSRIVFITSAAYKYAGIKWSSMSEPVIPSGIKSFPAYSLSKLGINLFARGLSANEQNIMVNVLHPGHVATGIWKMNSRPNLFVKLVEKINMRAASSPDEAADAVVYLASASEVEGVTDSYFDHRKITPWAKSADKERAKQFYNWLTKVNEKVFEY
jgi:NAD(P)-dependent dehydrogenase (short-subunit alcohol dehydrogenase family)